MLKRSSTTPLVLFAAGMAAGWVAKQLFDSPEVRERTKHMMMSASELRQRLLDSDEAERVREIFGKVSQDATSLYQDAKNSLVDELEALQVSFEDLDKRKYLDIVSDIVTSLREDRQLPDEQVKKLSKALSSDWQKISSHVDDSRPARRRIGANNKEE